ncbi:MULTISPECIES: TetR/AcrR family transcriptional regulator [Nocardiaceae]|uniref:TetR/AcrR family transcriptional regulator n=1 Tax=Nocardiaceae TaxID=85025 RepID=UPI001E5EC180|nr:MULTISPECIES: TetR/AcrR family transcriptional regulator [Rhodococcus]
MSARMSGADGPTRIERERRAQIIAAAVSLVAEHGYAAASLARIADAAGVVKGTVVYHFTTKDAVLTAAYQHVLTALVTHVGEHVDASPPPERPEAYVRAMIGYLADHPDHARTMVQAGLAAANNGASRHERQERWRPLAGLLSEARGDDRGPGRDERTLAILAGGMIDAVVDEFLEDPTFDTGSAASEIVEMVGSRLGADS